MDECEPRRTPKFVVAATARELFTPALHVHTSGTWPLSDFCDGPLPPPRPGARGSLSAPAHGRARAAGAAALKAAGGAAPYDEAVWRTVAERLTERR